MPGFWMAPYRGRPSYFRFAGLPHPSRVRNQLWVGQLHASDAHRVNSSGPTLGTVRVRVQIATAEGLKIAGVVVNQRHCRDHRSRGDHSIDHVVADCDSPGA